MLSYVTTSSPADGWDTISTWTWTFPDGQTKSGAIVQWTPTATCVAQNVTLTVAALISGSITTASATVAVTVVAAPTWNVTKYTRSGGADGHTGNGNTDGNAYQHLCEGFFQYARNNLRDGTAGFDTVGMIAYQNGGDSLLFGSTPPGPLAGPVLLARTGAGANPVYSVPTGTEFDLAAGGATDSNSYSTPVWSDGVDFAFVAIDTNNVVLVDGHVGCALANGVISKSGVTTRGFTFVVLNMTIQDNKFTGLGASNGAGFIVADTCTIKTNGTADPTDHQSYFSSGTTHIGVVDCTLDQNGANAYSGMKTSGSSKVYSGRNSIKNCKAGYDIGSNGSGDPVTSDYVIDAPVLDGGAASVHGFYTNFCNRISIRNARVYAGCSTQLFREQSYSSSEFVQNVNVYNVSANLITGMFGNFVSNSGLVSWFTGIKIKNCAVVKANSGVFYTLQYAADVAKVSIDYNVYWRVGNTPGAGDAAFANVAGVDISWAAWQALGLDTHSVFQDPQFTAAKDVTPTAGSPCLNAGTPLGSVTKDAAGTTRSTTTPTIGAIEVAGTNFTETMDVGTFALTGQSVGTGVGVSADVGLFTLTGQDVAESSNGSSSAPPSRPLGGDNLSSYAPAMKEVYIQRKPGLFN